MRKSFAIDKSTGKTYEYDLDTGEPILYDLKTDQYIEGEGFLTAVGKKVTSKLTGEVSKDIAQKAITKAAEKSAEHIGIKTGEIIANKLDKKFNKKPTNENKGDKIIELLKTHPGNKHNQAKKQINLKYAAFSNEFDKLINM